MIRCNKIFGDDEQLGYGVYICTDAADGPKGLNDG
jgi:hypothetical protein